MLNGYGQTIVKWSYQREVKRRWYMRMELPMANQNTPVNENCIPTVKRKHAGTWKCITNGQSNMIVNENGMPTVNQNTLVHDNGLPTVNQKMPLQENGLPTTIKTGLYLRMDYQRSIKYYFIREWITNGESKHAGAGELITNGQ